MNRVAIALAAAIAALALASSGFASSNASPNRAWAATAIPQARLEIAGTGPRVSALSSDGRVAVVGDPRGVYLFRASFEGSWDSFSRPTARLRLPHTALVNLTAVATSSDGTTVLVATGAVGNTSIRCLCLPRLVAASLDIAGNADCEAHERRGPDRLRLRCRPVVRRDDGSRRRPGGSGRLSCRDCRLVAG